MTGQELFEKALDICGLRATEADLPTDIADLQQRALPLINLVLAENSILDARIRKTEHSLISIAQLSDEIQISDITANLVLPFGLARLFMLGEDDGLAGDINKLYIQGQKTALTFGKAKAREITEVYG